MDPEFPDNSSRTYVCLSDFLQRRPQAALLFFLHLLLQFVRRNWRTSLLRNLLPTAAGIFAAVGASPEARRRRSRVTPRCAPHARNGFQRDPATGRINRRLGRAVVLRRSAAPLLREGPASCSARSPAPRNVEKFARWWMPAMLSSRLGCGCGHGDESFAMGALRRFNASEKIVSLGGQQYPLVPTYFFRHIEIG